VSRYLDHPPLQVQFHLVPDADIAARITEIKDFDALMKKYEIETRMTLADFLRSKKMQVDWKMVGLLLHLKECTTLQQAINSKYRDIKDYSRLSPRQKAFFDYCLCVWYGKTDAFILNIMRIKDNDEFGYFLLKYVTRQQAFDFVRDSELYTSLTSSDKERLNQCLGEWYFGNWRNWNLWLNDVRFKRLD